MLLCGDIVEFDVGLIFLSPLRWRAWLFERFGVHVLFAGGAAASVFPELLGALQFFVGASQAER